MVIHLKPDSKLISNLILLILAGLNTRCNDYIVMMIELSPLFLCVLYEGYIKEIEVDILSDTLEVKGYYIIGKGLLWKL